jgi:hypothetical protein
LVDSVAGAQLKCPALLQNGYSRVTSVINSLKSFCIFEQLTRNPARDSEARTFTTIEKTILTLFDAV